MGDFSVSSAAWPKEKVLHDGGYGGVVFCCPDAGLAVRIVADGYGDVADGASLDWAGFWMLISIVRRRTIITRNEFR